jgi:hypothetical protein
MERGRVAWEMGGKRVKIAPQRGCVHQILRTRKMTDTLKS